MTKRVLVPISKGFEEIEAVTVIDILKRAGAEVVVAGVDGDTVTGRSAITVIPDMPLDAALAGDAYDLIVLPGGVPNAYTLRDDDRIIEAVRAQAAAERPVAAICAAPVVLEKAGLLAGRTATSHPTAEEEIVTARFSTDRVVKAGLVTTSRSCGTAMEFALSLVRDLFGDAKVAEINKGVLAKI
jgi:protein deglycase